SGRIGAIRMGFRHSLYCIGCCWLFMLVLFISGSMSLLWMGGLSVAIFAEKLGVRTILFARVIGVPLVALGALAGVGAFIAMSATSEDSRVDGVGVGRSPRPRTRASRASAGRARREPSATHTRR